MASNKLFKELLKPDILKIGWHLAQGDSRDDFVRDPVGHADYATNLSARLEFVIKQIQSGRYRPTHLLEVDIPKSGLSVRPGNVLPIEEASILHAALYLLAPKLDKKLSKSVYSYRLRKDWKEKAKKGRSMFREVEIEIPFLKGRTIQKISPFDAWYERWPAFEDDAKKQWETNKYTHLTKTDIFSFFENIDLRYLQDFIRSKLKIEEEKLLQLIFTILNSWTRAASTGMPINRGIPQGNEVSSFFGNIVLIPLDQDLDSFCRESNGWWARYVDDIKIYTHSEKDARRAVFIINESLRQMHLNLQGAKTEIIFGEDLKKEHDNNKLDKVNAVCSRIQKLSKTQSSQKEITKELSFISPYFKHFTRSDTSKIINMKNKENRLFRRLLATYGAAGRTRRGLFKTIYNVISEVPDLRLLKSSLAYLKKLDIKHHDNIVKKLLELLEDDILLFPYQKTAVLEALIELHPNNPKIISSRVRKFAFGKNLKKNSHWLIIQKALEVISVYPYRHNYIPKISKTFINHEHPLVRRAAVILLPRSKGIKINKQLLEYSRHPDHGVSSLAHYLIRLSTDTQYATKELDGFKKMNCSDNSIIRRMYVLYAASASTESEIARKVNEAFQCFAKSKSMKIQWHKTEIEKRTMWAYKPKIRL
jgi:hypothetical protein